MNLKDKADQVTDRDSFIEFLDALAKDRRKAAEMEGLQPPSPYGPDAGGWENTSIESYLEACAGWARDSDCGELFGLSLDNPWKMIAAIFYCGRIYE